MGLHMVEEAEGKAIALVEEAKKGAGKVKEKGAQEGREDGEREAKGLKEKGIKAREGLRLQAERRLDEAVKLIIKRVFD